MVGWSCLDGAGSVLRAVVVVFGPENGEADARRETCEAVSASGGDELGGDGGVGWGAVGAGAGEGGCCECVIVEAGGGVFVLRGRRCRVDGGVCHFGYGALVDACHRVAPAGADADHGVLRWAADDQCRRVVVLG